MAKAKTKIGYLDLVYLFEDSAQELLRSVGKGRAFHKTKNIKSSGAPFEERFRTFLQARLPLNYTVSQGYLCDLKFQCSPQIDAMVLDKQESHEFMRSDAGEVYVPYSSARTLFELKNSAVGLTAHFKQIRDIAAAYQQMKSAAVAYQIPPGPHLARPLSILVIGDSSKATLASIKKAYSQHSFDPGFTLLLDRGLIIGKSSGLEPFTSDDTDPLRLDYYSYKQSGEWGIYEPDIADSNCGRALLWLYYAIVAQLNVDVRGNQSTILDFTNQVARDFPMIRKSPLHSAASW